LCTGSVPSRSPQRGPTWKSVRQAIALTRVHSRARL
jgi:hypothetical protein